MGDRSGYAFLVAEIAGKPYCFYGDFKGNEKSESGPPHRQCIEYSGFRHTGLSHDNVVMGGALAKEEKALRVELLRGDRCNLGNVKEEVKWTSGQCNLGSELKTRINKGRAMLEERISDYERTQIESLNESAGSLDASARCFDVREWRQNRETELQEAVNSARTSSVHVPGIEKQIFTNIKQEVAKGNSKHYFVLEDVGAEVEELMRVRTRMQEHARRLCEKQEERVREADEERLFNERLNENPLATICSDGIWSVLRDRGNWRKEKQV